MTAPAQTIDSTDKRQLLAACRVAVAELKLNQFAIEEVALTLAADRISTPGAMAWLRENGCEWVFERGPT